MLKQFETMKKVLVVLLIIFGLFGIIGTYLYIEKYETWKEEEQVEVEGKLAFDSQGKPINETVTKENGWFVSWGLFMLGYAMVICCIIGLVVIWIENKKYERYNKKNNLVDVTRGIRKPKIGEYTDDTFGNLGKATKEGINYGNRVIPWHSAGCYRIISKSEYNAGKSKKKRS